MGVDFLHLLHIRFDLPHPCRCVTIVCNATDCDDATATAALEACGYRPKTAIVMVLCGVGAEEAKAMLDKADGRVAKVLEK